MSNLKGRLTEEEIEEIEKGCKGTTFTGKVFLVEPEHYDNSKGSLYQFAEDHNLNSWEFDCVKRLVRCRKKGNFIEDLEKTKFLIDLYIKEFKDK